MTYRNVLALVAVIAALAVIPIARLYAEDKAADAPGSAPNTGGDEGFKPLFDGKSLEEWDGDPKFWSVQDGAITGKTTAENPTNGNTFAVWKGGEVKDFELRFKYKIIGGNSGVQYRSKQLGDDKYRIGGYQADFEAGEGFTGILYDEGGIAGGRGIMAERGQKAHYPASGDAKKEPLGKSAAELGKVVKKEDWNEYVIIANGNHLTHKINGETMVEVIDESDKALKSGLLALQLHAGPPMTVQFKDIRIKDLGGEQK